MKFYVLKVTEVHRVLNVVLWVSKYLLCFEWFWESVKQKVDKVSTVKFYGSKWELFEVDSYVEDWSLSTEDWGTKKLQLNIESIIMILYFKMKLIRIWTYDSLVRFSSFILLVYCSTKPLKLRISIEESTVLYKNLLESS